MGKRKLSGSRPEGRPLPFQFSFLSPACKGGMLGEITALASAHSVLLCPFLPILKKNPSATLPGTPLEPTMG